MAGTTVLAAPKHACAKTVSSVVSYVSGGLEVAVDMSTVNYIRIAYHLIAISCVSFKEPRPCTH